MGGREIMEEEVRKKLMEIEDYLSCAETDIIYTKQELDNLYDELKDKEKTQIKDVQNFKRQLRKDGLYSDKLEEFIENYMRFYNK